MESALNSVEKDEHIYNCLLNTALEGVMFHNYNVDLFDLLDLKGFKKLHMCQYKDEHQSLKDLKHEYITYFHKLPQLNADTSQLWKATVGTISEDAIPQMVRDSFNAYYDWETSVLEKYLTWRKEAKDKAVFQEKIKDVMNEIERLETIMSILDEHDYNYECICEVSDYLYH